MKKLATVLIIALTLVFAVQAATPAKAADQGAAALLSCAIPGAGEWYNSDYKNGGFPWGECIVGKICFCFAISSALMQHPAKQTLK